MLTILYAHTPEQPRKHSNYPILLIMLGFNQRNMRRVVIAVPAILMNDGEAINRTDSDYYKRIHPENTQIVQYTDYLGVLYSETCSGSS